MIRRFGEKSNKRQNADETNNLSLLNVRFRAALDAHLCCSDTCRIPLESSNAVIRRRLTEAGVAAMSRKRNSPAVWKSSFTRWRKLPNFSRSAGTQLQSCLRMSREWWIWDHRNGYTNAGIASCEFPMQFSTASSTSCACNKHCTGSHGSLNSPANVEHGLRQCHLLPRLLDLSFELPLTFLDPR